MCLDLLGLRLAHGKRRPDIPERGNPEDQFKRRGEFRDLSP